MMAKVNSGSRRMRRSKDRIVADRSLVTSQPESVAGFAAGGVIGVDFLVLAFLLALDAGLRLHVLGGQLGEEAGIRDPLPAHGDADQPVTPRTLAPPAASLRRAPEPTRTQRAVPPRCPGNASRP